MRITFRLRFHTHFGQSLWLTGNHEILGNGSVEHAIPLQFLDLETWQVTFIIPPGMVPNADIVYRYFLREPDGTILDDWGNDRLINFCSFMQRELLIIDAWNPPGFYENVFYTEPFKQVLLKPNYSQVRLPAAAKATHVFKAKAPLLEKGQTLCLLGSGVSVGKWDTAQPVVMNRLEGEDFLTAN